MAAIPPKFIYQNAGPYFRGELDAETAKRWERAVQRENEYYARKHSSSDDSWLLIPFICALFGGFK